VQETERQRANIADLRAQGVRVQTLRALNAGANETVIVVASVAILIVGGRAVAQDAMTVGQLLSFYTGLVLVRPYFQNIALSWPYWIEGRLALQSLAELEDTQIDAPYTGAAPLDFQGEIRLEGVQFHYQDAPTLHDITFTLPRGGLIGLIGPNGSGKSTIVNLILGFYRPQAGRLLADGQPYADLDLLALRRQMAVVMQAPILFPGTVWDNLVYGLPQATGAEVYAAAQEAGAHALILGLPQGYQTLVGEKGLLLSGGQRQRIALTRALLRQPRLLILDEPTNHLDADAVLDLLDLLTRRPARPTTLVISHDLRLARCMDQLVLLDGGGVVAAGAAAEVLPSLAASGKLQKSGS
jgi:ABC-type bacteriocin/lantibiotic exporter with double-glycine peptidase domain